MASTVLNFLTPIEPERRRAKVGPTPAAPPASAGRRLDVAATSSRGSQHAINEDAHSPASGSGRMFVVADGVGGGAMAELASRMLVAELHASLEPRALNAHRVSEAILAADQSIAAAIARITNQPGAATVVLGAALDSVAAKWLIAWVGDCRAYRWSPSRSEIVECLSRDDTFANLGETAPPGGSPDDPARMVGNGATSGANVVVQSLQAGELLLLCSDGVHKHLDDVDWCRVLAEPLPLALRGEKLVTLARARGSVDDATVLLIQRCAPAHRSTRETTRPASPFIEADRSKP
jgi:protein phosphatase